jgi:hypothetical protein
MIGLYKIWIDLWVESYYKLRYGPGWRWYWLNYQYNGEFLP